MLASLPAPLIVDDDEHLLHGHLFGRSAWRVLVMLHSAGHTSMVVGGALRDILMGRRPRDVDVLTSAKPDDIRRLFRHARQVGRAFPIMRVGSLGRVVEVSSFETGVPARLHPPSTSHSLPAPGSAPRRRGGKPGDLSSREAEPLLDAQSRLSSMRREAWLDGMGVDGAAEEPRSLPWLFDDFEDAAEAARANVDEARGTKVDGVGELDGDGSSLGTKSSPGEGFREQLPTLPIHPPPPPAQLPAIPPSMDRSWALARRSNASRRDFSINGLLFDPFSGLLYDYVGGLADCRHRVLRTIGPPQVSFRADPARALRALRLVSRAGLWLDAATAEALPRAVRGVRGLSESRKLMELHYLLAHGSAAPAVRLAWAAGLLPELLPAHARLLRRQGYQGGGLDRYVRRPGDARGGARGPPSHPLAFTPHDPPLFKMLEELDRLASVSVPVTHLVWATVLAAALVDAACRECRDLAALSEDGSPELQASLAGGGKGSAYRVAYGAVVAASVWALTGEAGARYSKRGSTFRGDRGRGDDDAGEKGALFAGPPSPALVPRTMARRIHAFFLREAADRERGPRREPQQCRSEDEQVEFVLKGLDWDWRTRLPGSLLRGGRDRGGAFESRDPLEARELPEVLRDASGEGEEFWSDAASWFEESDRLAEAEAEERRRAAEEKGLAEERRRAEEDGRGQGDWIQQPRVLET